MASWSARRQAAIVGVGIFLLIALLATGAYFFFRKPGTCFDGFKDATETGVDCGGQCIKICPVETVQPIILWQRLFPANTDKGLWSVVADIENPNAEASIGSVSYLFKIYDQDGAPIGEVSGSTYLPANQITPVYESYIPTGKHIPVRATFEFTSSPTWMKPPQDGRKVSASSPSIASQFTMPRITSTVRNLGINTEKDIEVIAVVYDASNNAIAASRTVIDELKKNESAPAVFTWRAPFGAAISRVEIVPRISSYGASQ